MKLSQNAARYKKHSPKKGRKGYQVKIKLFLALKDRIPAADGGHVIQRSSVCE